MSRLLRKKLLEAKQNINDSRIIINEKYIASGKDDYLTDMIPREMPDAVEKIVVYNLDDGDATPNDIITNKVGYIKDGIRVTGELDLTQATATPDDILAPKLAYTNNAELITGQIPVFKEKTFLLHKHHHKKEAPPGYYPSITAKLDDIDIVYIYNYENAPGVVQTVKWNHSFQTCSEIPPGILLTGWSLYPDCRPPILPPASMVTLEQLQELIYYCIAHPVPTIGDIWILDKDTQGNVVIPTATGGRPPNCFDDIIPTPVPDPEKPINPPRDEDDDTVKHNIGKNCWDVDEPEEPEPEPEIPPEITDIFIVPDDKLILIRPGDTIILYALYDEIPKPVPQIIVEEIPAPIPEPEEPDIDITPLPTPEPEPTPDPDPPVDPDPEPEPEPEPDPEPEVETFPENGTLVVIGEIANDIIHNVENGQYLLANLFDPNPINTPIYIGSNLIKTQKQFQEDGKAGQIDKLINNNKYPIKLGKFEKGAEYTVEPNAALSEDLKYEIFDSIYAAVIIPQSNTLYNAIKAPNGIYDVAQYAGLFGYWKYRQYDFENQSNKSVQYKQEWKPTDNECMTLFTVKGDKDFISVAKVGNGSEVASPVKEELKDESGNSIGSNIKIKLRNFKVKIQINFDPGQLQK